MSIDATHGQHDSKSKKAAAKRGRPRVEIPDLELVERLSSRGLSQRQIAAYFGMSEDTLCRRKKDCADFADALSKGTARGIYEITNALFQAALEGNFPAIRFFLTNKDRENWSDKNPPEQCKESGTQEDKQE